MFQPIVPFDGLVGWRFLDRTYDQQREVFAQEPIIQRDADYFRANITSVTTAEELTSDRRLMTVALGAFGLQDDIDNVFFIRKVLEEGTTRQDALANRLADTRYREFSEAFSLGPGELPRTVFNTFAVDIVNRFESNSFEVATGNQNPSMRIALYVERTLPELAGDNRSVDAKWFTVMGDPPMRDFFEKALNLPPSIGQIDIDQQLGVFKERADAVFGSSDFSTFTTDEGLDDAITRFIVRDQLASFNASATNDASIALSLLQGF